MRQGEACRLGRDDVDLNEETITIADSKFGKSRMVFLHPTAAAALRAYDRARDEAFPEPGGRHVPRQQPGPAAGQPQHPQDVRRARRGGGHQGPARAAGPAAARPAARLHGLDAAGLVPRRRRRPGPPPGPVHLARPCRPEVHLLVPLGRPRAPRPGRRQAGARRPGTSGRHHDRPGPRPAGVLHRPAGPAEEGQPEHGRRLPRHLPAPARLRPRQDRQAARASSASPTWTPPWSARS